MSLIKNLISEPENKPRRKKNGKDGEEDEEEEKPRPIIKSVTDLQRLKLEKLMKNPDKPVIIPEAPREKDYMQTVPSFVRNVMGSSAGAGSGEFHVYRHLRRKEYARQKTIQAKSIREQLDEDYQMKLEENRRKAEEKTAKKRAKRLKKKQRAKKPRSEKNNTAPKDDDKDEETSDDDDDDEQEEKSQELDDSNTVETTKADEEKNSGGETIEDEENNSVGTKEDETVTNVENSGETDENTEKNNSIANSDQDVTEDTNTESREETSTDETGVQVTEVAPSTPENEKPIEPNGPTRTKETPEASSDN